MNADLDPAVAKVFAAYPTKLREALFVLRAIIFETAERTEGAGAVREVLRWGQPSYVTSQPKSGTTIRLGPHGEDSFALFVHCQTTLVEEFRASFGRKLTYDGNRALVWKLGSKIPTTIVAECVEAALLYHSR